MEAEPRPDRKPGALRTFGGVMGLLMSAAFLLFTAALILLEALGIARITHGSRALLCAMIVILGGPIPHFFVTSATKVEISVPGRTVAITGGYAVAIVAAYFFWQLTPAEHVWREVRLESEDYELDPSATVLLDSSPSDRIIARDGTEGGYYRLQCLFAPEDQFLNGKFRTQVLNDWKTLEGVFPREVEMNSVIKATDKGDPGGEP